MAEEGMINSPIKWAGGKSKIRKRIVSSLAKHECYVDVFGGAGWIIFAKPPSSVEIYNDIDEELVNFFNVIKETPDAFIQSFDWELVSRSKYKKLAALDVSKLNSIQRAHRFYYLIMGSWGGEMKNPRFQTSIKDKSHGNRLFGALANIENRIRPIHDRLKTVIIENLSWKDVVTRYDSPTTMMYLDPPYMGNHVNYRYNMREQQMHEELRDWMLESHSKLLLSSYDNPDVLEMFKDFHIKKINFAAGMDSRDGQRRNYEVIITNYPLRERVLRDYSFLPTKLF